MSLRIIGRADVTRHLGYDVCIPLMREAMIALSVGRIRQLPRSILDLEGGRAFGLMPGAVDEGAFGAKLVSVFPGRLPSHQGLLLLFDPDSGAPVCMIEAGELTAIRTASASAAATDALARPDAARLAILGTGEQARRHIDAIARIRPLTAVTIWGRSPGKAERIVSDYRHLGARIQAASNVREAVADADIVCTLTAAAEPILGGRWIAPGTHLNVVGSSRAGPAEIDEALVGRSLFFADHRDSVQRQGAEFLRAKANGVIGDDHIRAEIGEVFAGTAAGRRSAEEVTVYKSLGSIAQDIAAGSYLYEAALTEGFGSEVSL